MSQSNSEAGFFTPFFRLFLSGEQLFANLALAAMVLLPLAEIVVRPILAGGIPGSIPFVQHLTLWVGFLGASLAARDGKLIALATASFLPDGRTRHATQVFAAIVGAAVSMVLAAGAHDLMMLDREDGTIIAAGVPVWLAQLVLPLSFSLIGLRLVWRASPRWSGRATASVGLLVGLWLGGTGGILEAGPVWPLISVVLVAAVFGAPIFTVLGGIAALLYMGDGDLPVLVSIETYALSIQPHLPAIPLFTLAGFILAAGKASERLLRLFRAAVGWVPGGTAIVCVVLCAFFTVFTGGSGVTILALGGVLFPALLRDGYRERFSLGLLTASGSLGLLFPPAMPLILYAIVAQVAPDDLFVAGIVPGILLVLLTVIWGVREGVLTGAGRHRFGWLELRESLWRAKWELSIPFVVLGVLFSGFATLVETAAFTALYTALIQCLIHRDFVAGPGLYQAFSECVGLVGGVLIILGVAVGFTAYLNDADVPFRIVEWAEAHVDSRLLFLLGLNVFLLLVGCVMDIFSAIFVVVPLVVPVAEQFDVHLIHLGIIFIANLELGFLTPPVGLNLFLASYRFNRPLLQVYHASLPLLAILGFGVLVITYVPWLTVGLLEWLGRI
ncbi:MAG: C4-dicarboxylate ABC transporter permease [Acidobacteria bacterium]|nr:C4-dicarboxylate ABC transporter permease [Acidobacteriota bacterium]|tara:strand:+ start:15651 stop:17492 length:1842 start_codon:yes stop_codon:yes gene_type:complete